MKSEIMKNTAYGSHERHLVDIMLPENASKEAGLVFCIHGGGWIMGDKSLYDNELRFWSGRGFAAASMNYRYVSDNISISDELDDITAALGKVKSICAENGITVSKALLTGVSAGAHLSLLYGYSRAAEAPVKPACIVSYCGPTDLSAYNFLHSELFEKYEQSVELFSDCCGKKFTENTFFDEDTQEKLRAVSPLYYTATDSVPAVIAHGMKDAIVPFTQAEALTKKLSELGAKYDFVIYPNSDHGLNSDPDCASKTRELFIEYAEKYLR